MSREYSFTLTVPIGELLAAEDLTDQIRDTYKNVRVSRKTDRADCARFYISFPFLDGRPDLEFQKWFAQDFGSRGWELYGPTHGRWGLV